MFRMMRIFILLTIFIIVAGSTYLTQLRTKDWDTPVWITVYPINGDGSQHTARYIQNLKKNNFRDIETFFAEEGVYYKIAIKNPVSINIAPIILEQPPRPPPERSIFTIMFWSLQLRYWALTHDTNTGPSPDVQIFIIYYDPLNNKKLAHSLGLEKGHIGVVHAYAGSAFTRRNNVIVAHEFLHTLGASDKYELATGYPEFPIGFAHPKSIPRYPQTRAEIMAGRIPISKSVAVFPKNLYRVVIGKTTAAEINWISNFTTTE
ncbi:hypothetical protein JYT31_01015 [Beggiatoa alba]|nr:hypothetical protein [Beggiatoa alba]